MAYGGGDMSSLLGWMLLPQLAATYTLKIVHAGLRWVAPQAVPLPKTPRYALHRRLSYVFVIVLYLGYTLWSTEQGLGQNFYHMLGLQPDSFDPAQLRRNFRRLSLALHPDKHPGHEAQFIVVQHAYSVLSDPQARFVYDHAGAEAVKCQTCTSIGDYMLGALPRRLGVYLMYVLGSVAMQVFRIGKYGTYWRYIAIGTFAALELAMLTRTTDPWAIRALLWLAPQRTSFEIAHVLRQAMVCFFIALNQIGPQFIPRERNVNTLALAKELLARTKSTKEEVVGKAMRLASFYNNTGLRRPLAESFEAEMRLGMAMGASAQFREQYMGRLRDQRSAIALE
ncbi:hypothetical protein GGF46_000675 [Coemansia sp. RSA 552]|nr:hypothetical protein GGF46_000675 [Coemansia sp. RSA 552]